jgi:DNA invertase Pin-like site-specific DNA recombinase
MALLEFGHTSAEVTRRQRPSLRLARFNGLLSPSCSLLGSHCHERPLATDAALTTEEFGHLGREFITALHRTILPPLIFLDDLRPLDSNRLMRAIGYCRVSTDKQAYRGVSLEAQTAKIEAMAVVQGAEIAEMIVDAGESAKSLDRPGMVRLLELIERRAVDVVIVAKLDRLTRSVKDLAELLEVLKKRGVSLVSVAESLDTGSAAGRLVLNIMTAVSQWEREAIGERTLDAMRHKKAKGERVGTVPYGFRLASDGVRLEENADELAVVRRIRSMTCSGLSTRKIAGRLNEEGFRNRSGAAWNFARVVQIARG